jgi:hypothetical protein
MLEDLNPVQRLQKNLEPCRREADRQKPGTPELISVAVIEVN